MFLKKSTATVFCLLFLLAVVKTSSAFTYSLLKEIKSGSFGSLVAPSDIAIAPDGRMYIADSSNFRILVLDTYGNYVSEWTTSSFYPMSVAIDSSGNLYYVSNFFDNVMKFSSDGGYQSSWGSSGSGNGQFDAPQGIAVGPDGSVYVADSDNHRIQKFNSNGGFIKAWGMQGNGLVGDGFTTEPEFHFPSDLSVFGDLVLVLDTGNNRLQLFDSNGGYIAAAGAEGTGPAEFNLPKGLAIGPDVGIYISDTGNQRIQGFTGDGYTEFGSSFLSSPKGLTVDRGGNVYVADDFNDKIAVFKPDVIVFENGDETKVVSIPAPLTLTVDIQTNTYWSGVYADLYIWFETTYLGTEYRFYFDGGWGLFNNYTEMPAILSNFMVPDLLTGLVWPVLGETTGFPPLDLVFYTCFDRNIDGVFKPTDSVCDSVTAKIQ